MKQSKSWSLIMMLTLVLGTAIAFSSCSKDNDDDNNNTGGINVPNIKSELVGLWYPKEQFIDAAYTFWLDFGFDGNPIIYSSVRTYRFKSNDIVEEITAKPYNGRVSGSFYTFSFDGYTVSNKSIDSSIYRYSRTGNTIRIENGDILTLSNGKLHSEGGAEYNKVQ